MRVSCLEKSRSFIEAEKLQHWKYFPDAFLPQYNTIACCDLSSLVVFAVVYSPCLCSWCVVTHRQLNDRSFANSLLSASKNLWPKRGKRVY